MTKDLTAIASGFCTCGEAEREAKGEPTLPHYPTCTYENVYSALMLVADVEREACAKVAEESRCPGTNPYCCGNEVGIARAIRARGT